MNGWYVVWEPWPIRPWVVMRRDGDSEHAERFGRPYGVLPPRFATVQQAENAVAKLHKYRHRKVRGLRGTLQP